MLPDRAYWLALAAERALRRAREGTARLADARATRPLDLRSPLGHALPCRLHLPDPPAPAAAPPPSEDRGPPRGHRGRPGGAPPRDRSAAPVARAPRPAVFLCPGGLDGAGGVEGLSPVLTAPRLAREGFVALAWGPSGREGAPGPEDRNGPLHQAEAAAALQVLADQPEVDPARIVVVSISFGLVLALGATGAPGAPTVRALVDWEGPPSRAWFVSSRLRYRTNDEAWWRAREAVRLIGGLKAGYWRFQSRWDHVHGRETGLGREMVDAAVAAGVRDVRYREGPFWVDAQGRALVDWIREAAGA